MERVDPSSFEEVVTCNENEKWIQAMDEEMDSLMKNKTWELIDKPKQQKLVGCKWVYKKKEEISGIESAQFKVRLVAKSFTQRDGWIIMKFIHQL